MASPKKKLPVPVIIAGVVVLFGLTLLPGKKDAAPEEERGQITLAARYGLAALDYREDL